MEKLTITNAITHCVHIIDALNSMNEHNEKHTAIAMNVYKTLVKLLYDSEINYD